MTQLIIRPMQESDCEAMAKLHARAVLAAYPAAYGDEVTRDWAQSRRPERYLKARKGGEQFLVVEQDKQIIGFGSWGFSNGELSSMYIDPDYHGQGVGRRLFDDIMKNSRNEAAPVTWVKAALPARGFYEKMGFVFREFGTSTVQGHVIQDVLLEYPA